MAGASKVRAMARGFSVMSLDDLIQPRPRGTPEEEDFRKWLKNNRTHFIEEKYSIGEICVLARMVGFDPMLVARVLSHFSDAIHDRNTDNRFAFQMFTFENALTEIQKLKE